MVTAHMPRIHTVTEADATELARRVEPRDDVLVREAVLDRDDDHVELGVEAGPFLEYRRSVRWSPAARIPARNACRQAREED